MATNLEFRDGQRYDFTVHTPAILTVDVGESHPPPSNVLPNEQYVNPQQLDQLLQTYAAEAAQSKAPIVPSSAVSTLVPLTEAYTAEQAEAQKQQLIDQLNSAFQVFLEYVQAQASGYDPVMADHSSAPSPKPELLRLLDTSNFPVDEWRRKLNEVQANVKLTEVKDLEYQDQLQHDMLAQAGTDGVGGHVAQALNENLTLHKEHLLQDIKAVYHFEQYQNTLMKKMVSSYVTFYSWLLEQWNRNIQKLHDTHSKFSRRIELLWQRDAVHKDISQLLERYERFLQAYESHLPLEFTLSVNPRKEWRDYMAKQQPEECLRLMKNELHALDNVKALRPSLDVWKRELDQYDVQRLHKMNENRQRMKKRMEDAVETETRQTFQRQWHALTERVYKMGTDLHHRANVKLADYMHEYQQQQGDILRLDQPLQRQRQGYERRLALVDQPWATWMERRKGAINEWASLNYMQVSIASLLQVYDTVAEFRRYIDTQQEAHLQPSV